MSVPLVAAILIGVAVALLVIVAFAIGRVTKRATAIVNQALESDSYRAGVRFGVSAMLEVVSRGRPDGHGKLCACKDCALVRHASTIAEQILDAKGCR